jgi:hypothetical protein
VLPHWGAPNSTAPTRLERDGWGWGTSAFWKECTKSETGEWAGRIVGKLCDDLIERKETQKAAELMELVHRSTSSGEVFTTVLK